MLGEFRNLDLHYSPGLTGVSTGTEALRIARENSRVNLIITTPHLADMDAAELARRIQAEGLDVPVVLLAWDTRELADFHARKDTSAIERTFLWQGDARMLVSIVKSVEDWRNAEHDTGAVGVQVIILVEDNVRYYSSFLPVMYTELLHHSQRVIVEGLNLSQKILRMRARPKILLCTTWEEAERAFERYADEVLGIISDVEFPRAGEKVPRAGADFARQVRAAYPDVPIVLHSSRPENEALAHSVGADFLLKGSPLLLQELRDVMLEHFGFGDFVFRRPDGTEVGRAADLRGLEETLATVPEESIVHHAGRNHFSRWLKARTEFTLAHELRPRTLDDYASPQALRESLIRAIASYRLEQARTLVTDFDRDDFDLSGDFYRMGGGSLGGKARGLAFVRRLLAQQGLRDRFERRRDRGADLGGAGHRHLRPVPRRQRPPLLRDRVRGRRGDPPALPGGAVPGGGRAGRGRLPRSGPPGPSPSAPRACSRTRSTSRSPASTTRSCCRTTPGASASGSERAILAIKRVYASTFSQHAKAYLRATPYRLEEEKMAVILQRIVGAPRGGRFYPDFSGVARSHNFYPAPPMASGDGVVAVALGMGRAIVEGGACIRFCPRYPQHILQFSSVEDVLETTQREFWALPLEGGTADGGMREESFGLAVAEADGALAAVGSTYSPENDAVYDGLSRPGPRLVTFAPVLKQGRFPLAEVLSTLMEEGERGMGTPVEIEFAVNLAVPPGRPREFGFVQMRPLALMRESEAVEIGEVDPAAVLCRSQRVLGNGRIEGIRDLVVVDFQRFERARSREAAAEVGRLNGAPARGAHALRARGGGALGLPGPLARHPGHLGPGVGGAGDRGGGAARPEGDALAGHALLPEPDVVQRRLLHREPGERGRRRWTGSGSRRGPPSRASPTCATSASTSRSSSS